MPKKIITTSVDIEQSVMSKVRTNEITMKPKWYFVVGSVASMIGLIASTVVTIYMINLASFLLREHGPMGEWRLQLMIESFPVWLPIIAIGGLASGIWLLKQFDFSYKRNFWLIVGAFLIAIMLSAFIFEYSGLSDTWFRHGPMRGMYRQNRITDPNYPRGQGLHRQQGGGRTDSE